VSDTAVMALSWLVAACVMTATFTWVIRTRPQLGRIMLGVFWLGMAAINISVVAFTSRAYADMVGDAYVPGFATLFTDVVDLVTPVAFGLGLATWQICAALLLFAGGRAARWGIIASFAYLTGVALLGWPFLPVMLLYIPFAMLWRSLDDTVPARRVRLGRPHPVN
jgi:hypothetical protein